MAKTRSCRSLIRLSQVSYRAVWNHEAAYLIDGGDPAGTSIRPGEDGCLTTNIKITRTTIVGNNSRKPKGIEMAEFRFKPTLLLRKEKFDIMRDLCFEGFSE